jgi:hypothetical protein
VPSWLGPGHSATARVGHAFRDGLEKNNLEKSMKPRHALAGPSTAFVLLISTAFAATAQAQAVAPQPETPMVKPPPAAASGAASATNPDNMPVKNPDKPTNDKIIRSPPASAANAK